MMMIKNTAPLIIMVLHAIAPGSSKKQFQWGKQTART